MQCNCESNMCVLTLLSTGRGAKVWLGRSTMHELVYSAGFNFGLHIGLACFLMRFGVDVQASKLKCFVFYRAFYICFSVDVQAFVF